MPHKPLSIEDLRGLINKGEAKDPLVFLESIMNGQDPRKLSSIYDLICEIDDFSGGEITSADWSEIVDHVSSRYKYQSVSLEQSMSASKTIAEYLHAKRKQIDINDGQGESDASNDPLTAEEIELFKEKFNDEF